MTYVQRPWLKQYPADIPADLPGEYWRGKSALDVFRHTAGSMPDAPAIHYFDSTMTFKDLDDLSDSLASALQAGGIHPGDRVALVLQNVPAFPIAVYAIWKCGAIAVPCNPMLRQAELRSQLSDSQASVLICLESALLEADPAARQAGVRRIISVGDGDFDAPERDYIRHPESRSIADDLLDLCDRFHNCKSARLDPGPQDIAYLVYTSGTTGPSKGSMN
ncbi:MAG: AMP-binding protein, partial [Chloroflexota bacterium]